MSRSIQKRKCTNFSVNLSESPVFVIATSTGPDDYIDVQHVAVCFADFTAMGRQLHRRHLAGPDTYT